MTRERFQPLVRSLVCPLMRPLIRPLSRGLVVAGLALAAPVWADEARSLALDSAGAIVDLPEKGELSEAVTSLVESYGVFVGFGSQTRPELRAGLKLTRADLIQWLSGAADQSMRMAESLGPDQLKRLPLLRGPLCAGAGWQSVQDARQVADLDASAAWGEALANLLDRHDAAIVPANRKAAPAVTVNGAQAQACLASFAPDLRLPGKPSAPVSRGEFIIALARALDSHARQAASLAEEAEQQQEAERRARKYPGATPAR